MNRYEMKKALIDMLSHDEDERRTKMGGFYIVRYNEIDDEYKIVYYNKEDLKKRLITRIDHFDASTIDNILRKM